jgi:hypothetical protein
MEHSAFQMVSPSRDTDPATGELASHGTTAHFAVEAAGISCQVPSNANAGRRVELNDVKTGSYNDLTHRVALSTIWNRADRLSLEKKVSQPGDQTGLG